MAKEVNNNETLIRLDSLSRNFGNLWAVNELSLEIRSREIFGLLGPNGAGKTTAIRMICGILAPATGRVLVNEKPAAQSPGFRRRIGYAPQENVYWPKLSCKEQVFFTGKMYGLNSAQARLNAMQTLEMLGLQEKSGSLASSLSGGMKRRLNLALALVHDPEILILDEPEAGLDPQSRILVREYIRQLSKDKTIILSTHNMDEADRLSDRIAIMDKGELLVTGTPANLKKTVGKGDVLEVSASFTAGAEIEKIRSEIETAGLGLLPGEETLGIQGMNLVEKIPVISELITKAGGKILSMTLRENSLEDVFVYLTGRRMKS